MSGWCTCGGLLAEPSTYAWATIAMKMCTSSSLEANGPWWKPWLCSPRNTDSHASQSSRFVMSQNSLAYAWLKSGRSITSGGKSHWHSTLVRPGPSGSIRWVMT